jgi:hypothetical protein
MDDVPTWSVCIGYHAPIPVRGFTCYREYEKAVQAMNRLKIQSPGIVYQVVKDPDTNGIKGDVNAAETW